MDPKMPGAIFILAYKSDVKICFIEYNYDVEQFCSMQLGRYLPSIVVFTKEHYLNGRENENEKK